MIYMQTVVDDPKALLWCLSDRTQKRKVRHINTQIQENERHKKDDEPLYPKQVSKKRCYRKEKRRIRETKSDLNHIIFSSTMVKKLRTFLRQLEHLDGLNLQIFFNHGEEIVYFLEKILSI